MSKANHTEYMREYYRRPGVAEKSVAWVQRRRERLKQWFAEYKTTQSCPCGESHPACIDFHHRNPDDKDTPRGGISQVIYKCGWSIARIKRELEKCDPQCANCHRITHSDDTPKNKGVQQRGPLPSEEELAAMTRGRRYYWRHRDLQIQRKDRRIAERVAWYQELKTSTGCKQCDESRHQCLDYHHRDPKLDRNLSIGNLVYRGLSKARILAEIKKCDLLCANCHRKSHWELSC